jgi:hypothetical protein
MAYVTNISPGAAPLLWSSVDEAFRQINQNFTELQLYINDSSINPIDLTNLYTDLSPGDSETYSLGSETKRWRGLYVSSYTIIPENEENGVWIGPAQIKGIGTTVNLPENSTVGGTIESQDGSGTGVNLIIDPSKTFFKTIRVDTANDIVAPAFSSVLNIDSGNAISLTADDVTKTITINNAGVTDLVGSTGISVDSPTGTVTITNTGVTSIGPTTPLPSGLTAGSGISVDSSTGPVTITNTGILNVISGGQGIVVTRDFSNGTVQIFNSLPDYESFTNIIVDNDTLNQINANSFQTSLLINSGYGIILSKNTFDKRIVFEWDQNSDLIGSVFADDSTPLVDAVNAKIVGEISSSIGSITDLTSVNFTVENISSIGVSGVNIGASGFNNLVVTAGAVTIQNVPLVATVGIQGNLAGNVDGDLTGSVFADNSTMLIDGTGGQLVGPISSFDTVNSIIMNTATGLQIASTILVDIQGAAGAQIGIGAGTSGDVYLGSGTNSIIINGTLKTSVITSDDSSQIAVIPQIQFNSNIVVDGDLVLNGDNRIQANTQITVVPTLSAESSGSVLNITGIPAGEGFPGVVVSSPSEFIQIGTWTMLADGGLFSVPLSAPPDNPIIGAIYIANGVSWDPQSFATGGPYPVFYDGNDFLPMVPSP